MKLILWIQKIQLDIMEESQHHLYITCKACKSNFYTIYDFFFETVLRNEFIYFYRNNFPIFGALIVGASESWDWPYFI